jgi:hypothetical protein
MKTVWATSQEIENVYLEIQVNEQLGVLVVQDTADEPARLVFCSLFPEPERTFFEGLDRKAAGITLDDVRALLAKVEQALSARPFRSAPGTGI